jgi:hypothetical protein
MLFDLRYDHCFKGAADLPITILWANIRAAETYFISLAVLFALRGCHTSSSRNAPLDSAIAQYGDHLNSHLQNGVRRFAAFYSPMIFSQPEGFRISLPVRPMGRPLLAICAIWRSRYKTPSLVETSAIESPYSMIGR